MCSPPLPPEVVQLILEADKQLILKNVVRAGHVSRSWRIAARLHPLFSRNIALTSSSLTRGHLHFFLDRLAAAPGGKLHLHLALGRDNFFQDSVKHDVRTLVMPALAEAIARLVTLSLQCDEEFIPDILTALRADKAPRLEELKFYLPSEGFEPSYVMEVLPRDLLMGHAPLLEVLQMDACQFPAEGPLPAFASVRKLTRVVEPEPKDAGRVIQLHPERFFVSCPALEELSLNGNMRDLARSSWDACPPPQQTRLRRLTVVMAKNDESTEAVVSTFAHRGMLSITVDSTVVNPTTVDLMIATLDISSALHLDITGDRSELKCSVLDVARGQRRIFVHSKSRMDDKGMVPEAPFVYPFAQIAHRFTGITITECQYAWNHLVALFPWHLLASVQTLELTLSTLSFAAFEPERMLMLPALTQLKLVANESMGIADIAVDDLLFFMENMVDLPDGRRLILVLRDVRLCGAKSLLLNHFENLGPL